MGFRKNAFAKVWSVEGKDNYTKVRLSISRKDKESGEYVEDFSGFVSLIGTAHSKAKSLKEKDRIQIKECDVTTKYDKEKDKQYTYYKIFNLEILDENIKKTETDEKDENEGFVDAGDEQIPF